MLHKEHAISKALHQFFARSVQSWSKPITKNFWLLTRAVLVGESAILTHLVRLFEEHGVVRKVVEKFGRFLDALPGKELREHLLINKHRTAIGTDTIIAIDNTDLSKLYTEKLPWVSNVHDGSTDGIGPGCPVFSSAYVDTAGHAQLLHLEAYSRNATTYESENKVWEYHMNQLFDLLGPDVGIYVMDCLYDAHGIYDWLNEKGVQFCIRMNTGKPRTVWFRDGASALVTEVGFNVVHTMLRKREGKKQRETLTLASKEVRLREDGTPLMVVKITNSTYPKSSMYLITTLAAKTAKQMLRVYEVYLTRWKIEQAFRMVKQTFQLETMQLRCFTRVQNFLRLIASIQNFLAWLEITHAKDRSSPVYYAVKALYYSEQHISWQRACIILCQQYWRFNSALLKHPQTDHSALTLFTFHPLPF